MCAWFDIMNIKDPIIQKQTVKANPHILLVSNYGWTLKIMNFDYFVAACSLKIVHSIHSSMDFISELCLGTCCGGRLQNQGQR